MTKADKSKRTFFKKLAAAAGFLSASGYLSKLMVGRTDPIDKINENSTNDVKKQKNAWLQKQMVAMTDNEKKQMLDEILDLYKNNHA